MNTGVGKGNGVWVGKGVSVGLGVKVDGGAVAGCKVGLGCSSVGGAPAHATRSVSGTSEMTAKERTIAFTIDLPSSTG